MRIPPFYSARAVFSNRRLIIRAVHFRKGEGEDRTIFRRTVRNCIGKKKEGLTTKLCVEEPGPAQEEREEPFLSSFWRVDLKSKWTAPRRVGNVSSGSGFAAGC